MFREVRECTIVSFSRKSDISFVSSHFVRLLSLRSMATPARPTGRENHVTIIISVGGCVTKMELRGLDYPHIPESDSVIMSDITRTITSTYIDCADISTSSSVNGQQWESSISYSRDHQEENRPTYGSLLGEAESGYPSGEDIADMIPTESVSYLEEVKMISGVGPNKVGRPSDGPNKPEQKY